MDQDNISKTHAQVEMMGVIYGKDSLKWIWRGEDAEEAI
jgi:hypothetical protein